MAPRGFRNFTAETLASADLEGYCAWQSIQGFASDAARSAAVGANVREGMPSWRDDEDCLEIYNGTAWVGREWGTYTPNVSWTGGGGSVGNATVEGYYRERLDGDMDCHILFTWGSTTTAGSAQLQLSTPPGATQYSAFMTFGAGVLNDSGTVQYPVIPYLNGAGANILFSVNGSPGYVTSAYPITLATGDSISATIVINR